MRCANVGTKEEIAIKIDEIEKKYDELLANAQPIAIDGDLE